MLRGGGRGGGDDDKPGRLGGGKADGPGGDGPERYKVSWIGSSVTGHEVDRFITSIKMRQNLISLGDDFWVSSLVISGATNRPTSDPG
jgi:hypothetical protein